jgi:hypothetical protein
VRLLKPRAFASNSDIDMFNATSIEALIERLRRVLVAMTANSGQHS